MCDYNIFVFMADHWLITLILAVIASRTVMYVADAIAEMVSSRND